MKGEDTLGIGHRDACAGSTVLLIGHLLHGVQIVQALLKIGQALLQDRLSFLWFKILEECDARNMKRGERSPRAEFSLLLPLYGLIEDQREAV